MDALRFVQRFAGFVRRGYPSNASVVGHCPLVALMPCTANAELDQATIVIISFTA